MIRIGLAGIGFMGMIHYLASGKLRGARVTAICSRDPKKLAGDWRGIRGNFGPPGTQMDLRRVKRYVEFEEMCADPDIDLIDICTPTHLHPHMAREALRAGKHVLVEKAIALEPKHADSMLPTPARRAAPQSICTSTTPTSSASSRACRTRSSRRAWPRTGIPSPT
jgi:predicted dehydrogenase